MNFLCRAVWGVNIIIILICVSQLVFLYVTKCKFKSEELTGRKTYRKAFSRIEKYQKKFMHALLLQIVVLTGLIFIEFFENNLDGVCGERYYENDPAEYMVGDKSIDAYVKNESYKKEALFLGMDIDLNKIDKNVLQEYEKAVELKVNVRGMAYNTDLLDESKQVDWHRLYEIQDIVHRAEKKSYVPYEIFAEEGNIRKCAYGSNLSPQNAYQTARAFDDAVDKMTRDSHDRKMSDDEIEELTLYASEAVTYYVEYLKFKVLSDLSEKDVYYKLSLIFEKLYLSPVYSEKQKNEFLLTSYAFLRLCRGYSINDKCCTNDVDYYIGKNLFEIGMKIKKENQKEYFKNAQTYLEEFRDVQEQHQQNGGEARYLEDTNYLLNQIDSKLTMLNEAYVD